jgi:hypothetical protein
MSRRQTNPAFRQFNKFMAGLRDLVQYGKAHFGSQKKCHKDVWRILIINPAWEIKEATSLMYASYRSLHGLSSPPKDCPDP